MLYNNTINLCDSRPSHRLNSSALSWNCFRELLPLRTKLLVVILVVGRDKQILCMVADTVQKLLEIGFGRD